VVRTRTTVLQIHTRQWLGTYAGRGNGDYRGELASALQAITTYVSCFALPAETALVRLDGQYGDAVVYTQRAVYVASQTDCPQCALREHCLGRKAKGNRARCASRGQNQEF
jgi:hypothetical protein